MTGFQMVCGDCSVIRLARAAVAGAHEASVERLLRSESSVASDWLKVYRFVFRPVRDQKHKIAAGSRRYYATLMPLHRRPHPNGTCRCCAYRRRQPSVGQNYRIDHIRGECNCQTIAAVFDR